MKGKVDVLTDLFLGDSGKGKMVDFLAPNYDIVARFNGAGNAGHTIIFDNKKFALHLVPSGIFNENVKCVLGNGVAMDPVEFIKEVKAIENVANIDINKRLLISDKIHLTLPTHILLDQYSEAKRGINKIGTTLKGVGPTFIDKTSRVGIRTGDIFSPIFKEKVYLLVSEHKEKLNGYKSENEITVLLNAWFDAIDKLKSYNIVNTEYYLNNALKDGKSILAEGAQGALLDLDFGFFPYVTSSNTTVGAVVTGLGIPPSAINKGISVIKAYSTKVGEGPFITEFDDSVSDKIRSIGKEYGATTGRPRKIGWIDLPALKYACMINGTTELNLMKTDIFSELDEFKVCVAYDINGKYTEELPYSFEGVTPIYKTFPSWKEDLTEITQFDNLPVECKDYIKFIEDYIGVPVTVVSVGPDREQTIYADGTHN